MESGAQPGNKNAAKNKPWAEAIRKAIARRDLEGDSQALNKLAEKLLTQCDAGDLAALKELGDRLDGKANQSISGPDGDAIPVGIKVSYDRPG